MPTTALPKSASPEEANDWTDAELVGAVAAYLQMLKCELEGAAYIKSAVNRILRAGPLSKRKKGAIEFRMQNISATLYDLRLPYIQGYLPAKNVVSGVKERITEHCAWPGLTIFGLMAPRPTARY
jgi:5-methylcytosine-specific restriction protein A